MQRHRMVLFFYCVLLLAGCRAIHRMEQLHQEGEYVPRPLGQAILPKPPAVRPGLPLVAVLASDRATEITDILGPYAVLAASGAVNVYTVAPRRAPLTVWPFLEIVPHFDFSEFDRLFPGGPDAIVVPYFTNPDDPALVGWLRARARSDVSVLAVCEGARTAAAAGLLEGRAATTHFASLDDIAKRYPATRWRRNVRVTADENRFTTAGVSAAFDGALILVRHIAGEAARARAIRTLGLKPHAGVYITPELGLFDQLAIGWHVQHAPTGATGLLLSDGIDELHVAAILDTTNRSLARSAITLASERRVVRSRFGLDLVPRATASEVQVDRVVDPARAWRTTKSFAAYDRSLDELAAETGPEIARFVTTLIEYEWTPAP